jgi:NAD(P)-dependent dehydrogenase (short-subunit alcohol dehydrogenase family)
MTIVDRLRYDGKRALVVGGATGMGAAAAKSAAELGAEVIVMDYAPVDYKVAQSVQVDLRDPASIDSALEQVDGPIHAVFSAAGVADGTPGIEKINFIGHRHLIEQLLAGDMLPRGSAIGMISSAAGMGWENNLDEVLEYLAVSDFDAASAWAQEHNHADYMWSKKAINAYVAREAFGLLKKGIRINAIMPGPTNTPLAQANKEMWLGFGSDYRDEVSVDASTPLEQAYPLVFLCSDAAAGITGITMITDAGYFAAGVTGSYPPAKDVIGFLRSI